MVSQLGPSVTTVSRELDSVSLRPEPGTTLALGRGAYDGTLDIVPYPAGLAAVEETSLDRYLFGIAEVPSSWPDEALAAQAVAARTYLAWTLNRGRSINGTKYDYDICASQYCQVYRGPADVADSWAAAVIRTSAEILVYDDGPAQALYSSSAGSRTRSVQDIWGGSGLPYLEAVNSPEAGYTPYERWELEVTSEQFTRVFARSGYDFGQRIDNVVRARAAQPGQTALRVLGQMHGHPFQPTTGCAARGSGIAGSRSSSSATRRPRSSTSSSPAGSRPRWASIAHSNWPRFSPRTTATP